MKLGEWEVVDQGIERCLLELGKEIMAVKVRFRQGSIGAVHHHPHEQLTIVATGRFRFLLGTETRIVQTGDTLYIPSNLAHGTEALEAGELIDVFTPLRLDMLEPELALVGSQR